MFQLSLLFLLLRFKAFAKKNSSRMFLRFVHIRVPESIRGDFTNALVSIHLPYVVSEPIRSTRKCDLQARRSVASCVMSMMRHDLERSRSLSPGQQRGLVLRAPLRTSSKTSVSGRSVSGIAA